MSGNNTRASLLSGLRTGGVRTGPANMPQTAAIGGSFQPPRFVSTHNQSTPFDDVPNDMNSFAGMRYSAPMTAALDGRAPRFQQQQQQQMQIMQQAQMAAMAGMQGMQGMINSVDPAQAQLLQMQLMQAMIAQQQQAQKLQAEVALQHHMAMALNSQRQSVPRVPSAGPRMPSTAGPAQSTFNLPSNPPGPARHDHFGFEEEADYGNVPMTAALGGKFGSRGPASTGLNPNAATFKMGGEGEQQMPATPMPVVPPNTASTTVVISGGVSLGGPNVPPTPNPSVAPSKSESASSWRRPSNAMPPVGLRNSTPPATIGRQTPPTNGAVSSPEVFAKYSPPETAAPLPKYRPQPIRLRENASFAPSVTIDHEQGQSAYSLSKLTKPPSPTGSNSSGESIKAMALPVRHSQPVRQPRGPPASVEELTMKNFARRIVRSTSNPMVIMPEAQFVTAY
jgi:hypothetical protein